MNRSYSSFILHPCFSSFRLHCLIRGRVNSNVRRLSNCQMKEAGFYRLSLILPLAVPLLVASLLFFGGRLPLWLSWVALYITLSGIIGALPYLVLMALMLFGRAGRLI